MNYNNDKCKYCNNKHQKSDSLKLHMADGNILVKTLNNGNKMLFFLDKKNNNVNGFFEFSSDEWQSFTKKINHLA